MQQVKVAVGLGHFENLSLHRSLGVASFVEQRHEMLELLALVHVFGEFRSNLDSVGDADKKLTQAVPQGIDCTLLDIFSPCLVHLVLSSLGPVVNRSCSVVVHAPPEVAGFKLLKLTASEVRKLFIRRFGLREHLDVLFRVE